MSLPTLCFEETIKIDRFDGGAAEVKDEFIVTKCRERPICRSLRRQNSFCEVKQKM